VSKKDLSVFGSGITSPPRLSDDDQSDAVSIYFLGATLASAFVARWCGGYKVETTDGVFRVRDDEPAAGTAASMQF